MTGQWSMSMAFNQILINVEQYYTGKLETHGPTASGVDWNSVESQELRFEQLLKVCTVGETFSINDYGCGYGALIEYMTRQGHIFRYHGFDISKQMIAKARELHHGLSHGRFSTAESDLDVADYTVASGIFNVKLQTNEVEWQAYILHILNRFAQLSRKGFAFNILTSDSDPERRRPDLYYADPLFFFDYCKKNFSRFVSLLHDYPLYEFTILVKQ
jgi:SAM-dependent methyltransferase